MDSMQELKKLTDKANALSTGAKVAGGVAIALLALGGVVAFALSSSNSASYEVVFAKLTPEDSAASGDALRAAGIPFRIEAAGDVISVPASKVHDARLLLASQGLPRAGGVGFELFDKSDLGVSEFTQRVNLQRAIEGELSRTIGDMQKVRDARVHVTMPKRGLLRSEDKGASAAVVLHLEPGRTLDAREIAGVRHLVAAAVPELSVDRVTIVDQNGSMLGTVDGNESEARGTLERELESRVVAMLEPALGRGAVVARVTAEMDAAEEDQTESLYQPDRTALRSEHTRTETLNSNVGGLAGLSGAAANDPVPSGGPPASATRGNTKSTNVDDQTRTFDVSGSVTRRVSHEPRLVKLSVAVLVDAKGKPLEDAEMKKLTELAKRAVGYDEERGDLLELSSASFLGDTAVAVDAAPLAAPGPLGLPPGIPVVALAGAAVGLLIVGAAIAFVFARRRRAPATGALGLGALGPGATLLQLGAAEVGDEPGIPKRAPRELARAKARQLAAANPEQAALILEAWLGDAAGASATTTTTTVTTKDHANG